MQENMIRVGLGTDRHQFVEGRPLILGGIEIPFHMGLLGHSDADAVLHAISDALLGALGLGDIGELYSDSDPKNKDIDSALILKRCHELIGQKKWSIGNIDVVIHTEQPKLAPHREMIRNNIAQLLSLDSDQVSIKAKTAETLGPVGQGACLDVQAVVLLWKHL